MNILSIKALEKQVGIVLFDLKEDIISLKNICEWMLFNNRCYLEDTIICNTIVNSLRNGRFIELLEL